MTARPMPIPRLAPGGPAEPDADWETVRARAIARLTELVPDAWSDHNAADPGITLAESAAFGLADLHYRTAERRFDAWPLEVAGWLPDADRHWHHTVPGDALHDLAAIAAVLAEPSTSAHLLEPLLRAAASPVDAAAVLARAPWAEVFTTEQRAVVVALTRVRLVRQTAQEQADLIARTVAAQRGSDDPVAVRDGRAAAELAFSLPLWEDELRALVRRERRRLAQEALVARLAELRAVTAATEPGLRDALEKEDLSADEVRVALAAGPRPPGLLPEGLELDLRAGERHHGRTVVWPPHPVQALTCEPVTAADYARRARAHPDVARAWAVPGRLAGIAWNGLPTGTTSGIDVDPDAPAITLVVERRAGGAGTDEFLREVLAAAIGSEVRAPFPDWRDEAEVDEIAPRRTICDEVGAAALTEAPVIVEGVLVTGLGSDDDALVEDVRARIAGLFAAGRPETRAAATPAEVDGPWPPLEQPPGGWVPGEPIRFAEVVQAIVAAPGVWGIEQLAMRLESSTVSVPQSAGSLEIPPGAVPVLAEARCLRVRFSLTGRCDA